MSFNLISSDLDFNATGLSLELSTEQDSATITFQVYNDGVAEGEEGFAILLGVLQEGLDSRDVGFVDILTPVVLVRLQQGGTEPKCI